jgi:hypothetical protein
MTSCLQRRLFVYVQGHWVIMGYANWDACWLSSGLVVWNNARTFYDMQPSSVK